jgi:hypothetical protein
MTPHYHSDNTIPREFKGAQPWIWVFGSNEKGAHGAGAAKVAHVSYGAKYGVGRGMTGSAYAIPTKDRRIQTLPLEVVVANVAEFIEFAKANPDKRFYVTRVGCGLAGFQDDQIGPLFSAAPENCSLPIEWARFVDAFAV